MAKPKHDYIPTLLTGGPERRIGFDGPELPTKTRCIRHWEIAQHTVTLSLDGTDWTLPVAFGTFLNDNTTKYTFFTPKTARYVRLTAESEAEGGSYVTVAELGLYTPSPAIIPSTGDVAVQGDGEPPSTFLLFLQEASWQPMAPSSCTRLSAPTITGIIPPREAAPVRPTHQPGSLALRRCQSD